MVLDSFFSRYLPPLVAEMRAVVQTTDPDLSGLFGMLRYHLGWVDAAFTPCEAQTGKRVRPTLCLLICEACGGAWEQALPAAAAIELLHDFSLIHDDIMDRDETRRGRPTVWTLWGEGQAINAGDALFALAQLALLRLSERDVPAVTIAAALRLFNRDWLTTAGGQYLDMTFENRTNVSVQEYLRMVEGKTSLVPCACEMGALVAAAPGIQRERLRSFGFHLGLVFQITDDVLGIWGDPTLSGKPVGADIARRKKSLPILHGLERSAELQALLARQKLSADDVQHATRLLQETGSRAFAEQLAQEHYDSAMTALKEANLHETPFCALCEIAQKLLHRQK